MEKKDKKEVVIIPEKEPNQKDITQTFNELILIAKSVLIIALFMVIVSLIFGLIKSIGL